MTHRVQGDTGQPVWGSISKNKVLCWSLEKTNLQLNSEIKDNTSPDLLCTSTFMSSSAH